MDPYDDMQDRETDLPKLAYEAYEKTPRKHVGDYELVRETDTAKFYKKGKNIVVAVRGTELTSKDDLNADAAIAFNRVKNTRRFKKDAEAVKDVQRQFSPSEYNYSAVGHSLGGAIVDNLVHRGYVKSGTSYNPAIEPKYIRKHGNKRIYNPDDVLYKIEGRYASDVKVAKRRDKSLAEIATEPIPYLGKVLKGLKAHELKQFSK